MGRNRKHNCDIVGAFCKLHMKREKNNSLELVGLLKPQTLTSWKLKNDPLLFGSVHLSGGKIQKTIYEKR